MLGVNVVYVTGRGVGGGGVFHRPGGVVGRAQETACGLTLMHAMLMQREWAEHTDAQACEECYPLTSP